MRNFVVGPPNPPNAPPLMKAIASTYIVPISLMHAERTPKPIVRIAQFAWLVTHCHTRSYRIS